MNKGLKHGRQLGGRNSAKHVYILSGLVRCGKCGGKMNIANGGRNRDGSYWRVYRCKHKCVKGIEYQKLDNLVLSYLKDIAWDPAVLESALKIADDFCAMSAEDAREDLAALKSQLVDADKARGNLVAFVAASGAEAPRSLLEEIKKYDAQCDQLRAEISVRESKTLNLDRQRIVDDIDRIRSIDALSDTEKKSAVTTLIGSVTVHDDRIDVEVITTACGGAEAQPEVIVIQTVFFPRPTKNRPFPAPTAIT